MVEEVKRENAARDYESFIRIVVDAEDMPRHAGGTVFQDGKPRVTEIRTIAVDAEFAPHMIYVCNAAESPASSAASAPSSARPASTSRPSRSAATATAATRSASSPSTSPCRRGAAHRIEAIPQVKRAPGGALLTCHSGLRGPGARNP